MDECPTDPLASPFTTLHSLRTRTDQGRGDGVADKPWWHRIYDCMCLAKLHAKNSRQEEALYKGTLLRWANENFPQEDT